MPTVNSRVAKFQSVYHSYYNAIVAFATQYTNNREVSRDIVHDVLLRMWDNKIDIEISSTKSYLYTAVKNRALNHINHKKVVQKYIDQSSVTPSYIETDDQESVKAERIKKIHQAIQSLSKRRREVVQFSLKGYQNEEISEVLGISIQTVKNIKSEAYRGIKDFIKNR